MSGECFTKRFLPTLSARGSELKGRKVGERSSCQQGGGGVAGRGSGRPVLTRSPPSPHHPTRRFRFFFFSFFPHVFISFGRFPKPSEGDRTSEERRGKEKSNKMKQNESKSRSGISNSFHRPQRQGAGSQIWLLRLKVTPHPSQPAPLPAGPALSNQNIQTEVGGRVPESAPKRRRETPQIPPPIPQPGAPGCSFFFFFFF